MMATAIVTDSNSGIGMAEAKEDGIFMIPMPVIINDQIYFEGDNITEEEFYDALCSDMQVTTSMPSPGDLTDLWDSILSGMYDELVYIPMSSGLSNSCAASTALAQDYAGKVSVVDNHRISVTLRESVFTALELSKQGKTGKEIKEYLEKEAYDASIYIAVDTLEYLKRGGRVTPAGAALASVLDIKPILTIQGEKLDSFSKSRGMKKAFKIMVEALQKDFNHRFDKAKPENIHIGIAGTLLSEDEIRAYKETLGKAFPQCKIYYQPLSLSIGCHVGPHAVGIGMSYVKE